MTSQNNPLLSQRGSALIVTMLLVSVLLATALILLQRIVPYAKSVRSMHDASQAYYVARGQTDLARLNFLYGITPPLGTLRIPPLFRLLGQTYNTTNGTTISSTGDNTRDDTSSTGITTEEKYAGEDDDLVNDIGDKIIRIGSTFTNASNERDPTINEAYAVVSKSSETPLKIKLNPTDTEIRLFGTSKSNPAFHALNPLNSGGLRFDLKGVDTAINAFTLSMKSITVPANTKVTLKMQYESGGIVKTFTKEFTLNSNSNLVFTNDNIHGSGNVQSIDTGGNISPTSDTFKNFLFVNNCKTADICSLIFTVSNTSNQSVDFRLDSTGVTIPDLNAVVIGDGLSGNGLYYQRIIDLIPTPQDI